MKPCTYVLVVADESTSMLGVAQGLRDGVNAYLDDLACDPSRDYQVSLVTFSDECRVQCVSVPCAQAPRLTVDTYRPCGQTALLDAIGQTLETFGPVTGEDKVLFLLATDGAENASRNYGVEAVLDMVEERERSGRWTFIHLAAGHDAAQAGLSLGLRNVIAIAKADLSRKAMYTTMGHATRAWAAGGTVDDVTGMIRDELEFAGARR